MTSKFDVINGVYIKKKASKSALTFSVSAVFDDEFRSYSIPALKRLFVILFN